MDYYAAILLIPTDDPANPKEEVRSIFRVGEDGVPQRYNKDGAKWDTVNRTLLANGIGGDSHFVRITEEVAMEHLRSFGADMEKKSTVKRLSPITRRIVLVEVERGGPGSGNHGHGGLKGVWGGSSKQGGGKSSSDKKTQVGITSARPDRMGADVVREDMETFAKKLKSIKSLKDVKVQFGEGAWEGGSEPTWVVEYVGNGEATKLLAETAKIYDQDAVLVYEGCDDPPCSPLVEWNLGNVSAELQKQVSAYLVEAGFGGWTWYSQGNDLYLRAVAVPQWGGEPSSHMEAADEVDEWLNEIGINAERENADVYVTIMERDGDYAYDNYLE